MSPTIYTKPTGIDTYNAVKLEQIQQLADEFDKLF